MHVNACSRANNSRNFACVIGGKKVKVKVDIVQYYSDLECVNDREITITTVQKSPVHVLISMYNLYKFILDVSLFALGVLEFSVWQRIGHQSQCT